jgi:D-alanyl-D-alanine carboxypeptidase
MKESPERVRAILAALDIPEELVRERALPLQTEAKELVLAEIGDDGREYRLTPAAASAWRGMKAAAAADGIVISLISAFRSIERQVEILREKLAQGASLEAILAASAPPGYSEHHTGRAVDITTDGAPPLEIEFEQTAAFAWLTTNAARFGFVLSFPAENPYGYQYEPWHWRYSPIDELLIRAVTPGDVRAASALVHRSFNTLAAADWEPKARAVFLQESSPERLENASAAHAAGAFFGGEIVGFLSMPAPSVLSMLFVDPRHVRRGIGRALWEAARTHVESVFPEVTTVELNSTPFALPFYRAMGFTPISREFVREGCRVTRMAYRLTRRK